jgi:hypothetical protein
MPAIFFCQELFLTEIFILNKVNIPSSNDFKNVVILARYRERHKTPKVNEKIQPFSDNRIILQFFAKRQTHTFNYASRYITSAAVIRAFIVCHKKRRFKTHAVLSGSLENHSLNNPTEILHIRQSFRLEVRKKAS